MRIAITGGIGSGKSYVCRLLAERGIEVFNCDTTAKTIIATDPEVRQALEDLCGVPLTKERLGAYLRTSPDHAARVNAIVHPRVAEAFRQSGLQWMECAILFESGFDHLVDAIVVVTCPEDERIRRILHRDGCDVDTARRWLRLQLSDEERLARAASRTTYNIINDGVAPVPPQIDSILASL